MTQLDLDSFNRIGALRLHARIPPIARDHVSTAIAGVEANRAGVRLWGIPALQAVLSPSGPVGAAAQSILGPDSRPVRAILFNKTPDMNWALGWHQDRTIAVQSRRDVPGFGPWTVKDGMVHVAPPPALLARMVSLRVHLDPAPEDNAPLLIAPGSHLLGRIPVQEVQSVVQKCGTATCLADAGDVWITATLILHASLAASTPARRRVLQVDYSADLLPAGLEWLGI